MPIELGIWRIDKQLNQLEAGAMKDEGRLEDILDSDVSVASPNWMVIGRQVATDYGKYIDLLAIDRDGNIIVLELKRDKTPREVVAQVLDYGSWVKRLKDNDIAQIYENYLKKYHPENERISIDQAFCKRFNMKEMPEELNSTHQLVVVASELDDSTERIVNYLAESDVAINAIFFRVFRDDSKEYISRIWFKDPTSSGIELEELAHEDKWNGEFYVSFGHGDNRRWEDAIKYGFVSAGGGRWYSKTLNYLESGNRIWVNIPGEGYVGVGKVIKPVVRADRFMIKQSDGSEMPLAKLPILSKGMFEDVNDDELAEYLVGVQWVKTLPIAEAIKEKGFFGNQNTVCKPTAKSWVHTIERLKKRLGIE